MMIIITVTIFIIISNFLLKTGALQDSFGNPRKNRR